MLRLHLNKQDTVKACIDWASQSLSAGSDTPKLDAKLLLQHAGGFNAIDLILNANETLKNSIKVKYKQLIARRKQGMPLAYITGSKGFWSLDLMIDQSALIPRPETELLVETALKLMPKNKKSDIADMGTGSGAIALAIANERPNARLLATDYIQNALNLARQNAQTLNIKNIDFLYCNWFESMGDRQFDLIVSNPPYIDINDPQLDIENLKFEPPQALFSKNRGLSDIDTIVSHSTSHLKNNAWLLIEHGNTQANDVMAFFKAANFSNIKNIKDLNQQARITIGQLIAK